MLTPHTSTDAAREAGQKHIDFDAINIQAGEVFADPCHVIPASLWSEYCALGMETFEWAQRTFCGLTFWVKRASDGISCGACVDSGVIGRFPKSVLTHDFFAFGKAA